MNNDQIGLLGIKIPIIDDALDAAGSALKWLDKNVLSNIPGSDWVKDAVAQGETWLVDFAKNDFGFWTLQVITNGLYGPLAQHVGPQVASAVWATPGMIRGESFTKAYIEDFKKRLAALAAFVRGGPYGAAAVYYGIPALKLLDPDQIPDQAADAAAKIYTADYQAALADPELKSLLAGFIEQARGLSPADVQKMLAANGVDPTNLGRRLRARIPTLRDDQIAFIINALFHEKVYDVESEFAVEDGRLKPSRSRGQVTASDTNVASSAMHKKVSAFATNPKAVADITSYLNKHRKPGMFAVLPEKRTLAAYGLILLALTSPFWVPVAATQLKRIHR